MTCSSSGSTQDPLKQVPISGTTVVPTLLPFEKSWSPFWRGTCPSPTCKTTSEASAFPCPVCGGQLIVTEDYRYTSMNAGMKLRCIVPCGFSTLIIPCPKDKKPIQGMLLEAYWLEAHWVFRLIFNSLFCPALFILYKLTLIDLIADAFTSEKPGRLLPSEYAYQFLWRKLMSEMPMRGRWEKFCDPETRKLSLLPMYR